MTRAALLPPLRGGFVRVPVVPLAERVRRHLRRAEDAVRQRHRRAHQHGADEQRDEQPEQSDTAPEEHTRDIRHKSLERAATSFLNALAAAAGQTLEQPDQPQDEQHAAVDWDAVVPQREENQQTADDYRDQATDDLAGGAAAAAGGA